MSILKSLKERFTTLVALYILAAVTIVIWSAISFDVQNDTWWHLAIGQSLWNGTFTFEDTWSWTAPGAFWPAHELGYEWILYGLWMIDGNTFWGAWILNIILLLASLALLYPPKNLREKLNLGSSYLIPVLYAIVGVLLAEMVSIRAQAVSFFFFALTLRIILKASPYWFPLITLVWVWLHGSVILGIAVFGLATIILIVKSLADWKDLNKRKEAIRFSISGLLGLGTLSLSPLGLNIWPYLLTTADYKNTTISEWGDVTTSPVIFGYLIVLSAVAIYSFWRLRTYKFSYWYIFGVLGSLFLFVNSVMTVRIIANFAIFVLPFIFLALALNRKDKPLIPKFLGKIPKAILAAFTALAVIAGSYYAYNAASLTLELGRINPFQGEVKAALLSEECKGHTWNDYISGGFLMWFLPEVKVSVDSRFDLYPRWVMEIEGVYASHDPDEFLKYFNDTMTKYEINCLAIMDEDSEVLSQRVETIAKNDFITIFRLEDHKVPAANITP